MSTRVNSRRPPLRSPIFRWVDLTPLAWGRNTPCEDLHPAVGSPLRELSKNGFSKEERNLTGSRVPATAGDAVKRITGTGLSPVRCGRLATLGRTRAWCDGS